MEIRVLVQSDAATFQRLRLQALHESPTVFATHYDEERDADLDEVAARLAPTGDHAIWGSFSGTSLVGMVGFSRETRRNLRHKALLWGMYVAPAFRGRGIGRGLLDRVMSEAAKLDGLSQIHLWVHVASTSAVSMYRAAGFEPLVIEPAFLLVDGAAQDLLHMVHRREA